MGSVVKIKERTVLRQQFTILKKKISESLTSGSYDEPTRANVELLSKKVDRLLLLDRAILDSLLEQEDDPTKIQEEMDGADKYQSQWLELTNKIASFKKDSPHSEEESEVHTCQSKSVCKRKYKLPLIDLTKFDGDVRNWLQFWGQFQKIHTDEELGDYDKFQYLLSAIPKGTEARDLIGSFPPYAENYHKAVDHLKQRYGREELLIEVYVRELLTLIISQVRGQYQLSLTSLYDKLTTQLRALESMGLTSDKYACMLYPMVESALPAEVLKAWERYHSNNTNKDAKGNELDQILTFLKHEVESNQRITLARTTLLESTDIPSTSSAVPTTSCLVVGDNSIDKSVKLSTNKDKCVWCSKENHTSMQCYKALELSLDSRKEHLKKAKACFICLRIGHSAFQCKSRFKCLICLKRHNALVCPDAKAVSSKENKKESQNIETNELSLSNRNSVTLLQTLLVKISFMGKEVIVRALLDSGAQRSYMTRAIIKQLGLKPLRSEQLRHVVFGGTHTKSETHNVYDITLKSLEGTNEFQMIVLDEDKLCGSIPRIQASQLTEDLKKHNILLTDMGQDISEVGLLIGADYRGLLMTSNVIQLENGLTAIQTKLGWTIQGSTDTTSPTKTLNLLHVTELWDLETIGIKDSATTKQREEEENEVLSSFKESVTINEEGRYEVNLPFREHYGELMSNKDLAEKRLISTTKRLTSSKNFERYDEVFKDWLSRGIIEEVMDDDGTGHYLAHHAVIKEARETTKVRPVFDASAKDKAGNSLNNCLYTGMNFLELIPKLLMRFRLGETGVTADIEKAFLQISVRPSDRNLLKFLWWKNSHKTEMITYRHRRVVFGLTCSPFLLNATIAHHLMHVPANYHITAQKLLDSFYVDNCIINMDENKVESFKREAIDIMNLGKFNLRDWVIAPRSDHQPEKEVVSVLGVMWHTKEDTLSCKVDIQINAYKRLTRRTLLSIAQSIYDPIGFTSPTALKPKILLQESWHIHGGWDDELPQYMQAELTSWLKTIHLLGTCHIPRRLYVDNSSSLHVFCDSSKTAYATCIFVRTEKQNTVNVQLVLAKTRVAPTKQKITIPRLELLAALIATRLSQQVLEALSFKCPVYYWSDSSVVLTWIKKEATWATFIRNRVKEIRELTNRDDWHFVPGVMNPADLPSRGCDAEGLVKSKWWLGPDWLASDKSNWPDMNLPFDSEADKELRKTAICTPVAVERAFSSLFLYFSKYSKIIRMFAWLLRFINNMRVNSQSRKRGDLTYDDIDIATKILFKLVQSEMVVSSNIATFKDEIGLLRVRTKLLFCEGSADFKNPILLPGKHEIVKRLIQQQHEHLYHAGVGTMMSVLREKYWIIGVRRLIKSIIAACVKCKRHKVKPCTVPFAPLPCKRIDSSAAAFETCGIDYAGPLILRSGAKAYIVLFTCAVYRALHLELTDSLSTESFLMALRRFIARRGRVKTIYTDNGTNFVGAWNLLKEIDWSKIEAETSVKEIRWIFNPPTAAWWGGWWERLVRSVKDLLKRTLGKAILDYSELQTILCECEAIINARPLTYITESDTLTPLTPSHFLQDIALSDVPDLDEINRGSLNRRWRYLQNLRDGIRQRFKKEYLSLLVHKGREGHHELRVGDVVLMEADTKRVNWPLAFIEELQRGSDGHTRVAKLKTQAGQRIRPVQKLYPLEITEEPAREIQTRTRSGRVIRVPERLKF